MSLENILRDYNISECSKRRQVHQLLSEGANVNDVGPDGVTALMAAAQFDYVGIVSDLLDRGANVNAITEHGWTALMFAVRCKRFYIVDKLIRANADVNIECASRVSTALSLAAYADISSNINTTLKLLTAGANVNWQSNCGMSMLMTVCSYGHMWIAEQYLLFDANVNLQNQHGDTAIMKASEQGHLDIVQLLLDANANIDLTNVRGETALMKAWTAGYFKVVILLLRSFPNICVGSSTKSIFSVNCGKIDSLIEDVIHRKPTVSLHSKFRLY